MDWGWLLCICILWWAWWKTQGLGPHRELLRNGRARSGEGHYHQPCDHLCSLPAFYLSFSPVLLQPASGHHCIFSVFLSKICFLDAIAASTRHHFAFLGSLVSLFAMEVTSTHCPAWLCTPHWVPCPLQECILYSPLQHCCVCIKKLKTCVWFKCAKHWTREHFYVLMCGPETAVQSIVMGQWGGRSGTKHSS